MPTSRLNRIQGIVLTTPRVAGPVPTSVNVSPPTVGGEGQGGVAGGPTLPAGTPPINIPILSAGAGC